MRKILWCVLILALTLSACNLPGGTPPAPSATPGPSPTPSLTPSPTLPPTATPSPTPVPAARISEGQTALALGNLPGAREAFQAALLTSSDPAVQAQALLGTAQVEFSDENYSAMLEPLRSLLTLNPATPTASRAWFLLGEAYTALNRYPEAASAYEQYLQLRPGLLDALVQKKRGDSLWQAGDLTGAMAAYQAAQQAGADPLEMTLNLGQLAAQSGDPQAALLAYEQASALAVDDYTRARIDYLAGQALLDDGQTEAGYGRWRNAVYSYPLSYDSYLALAGLVNANQPVNEFDRGLVDYYAGQLGVAQAAFERFIAAEPGHDGTALHYLALIAREQGNYIPALTYWQTLIDSYPENRYWTQAWQEKAETQWAYLEEYAAAADTLETFATQKPESADAPAALMQAGRIAERGGDLSGAARLWESLTAQYPTDPLAVEALFQAGIAHYRAGKLEQAQSAFERDLILATEPSDRARAQLWQGKAAQARGDLQTAQQAWQTAQTLDQAGYYSLRARDLLLNRAPFASPASLNADYDLKSERAEAAAWLRVKFNLPPETNLLSLDALEQNPRWQRGVELWNLGLSDEARLEMEALREEVSHSAVDSFRLGNALLDLGLYRPAIFALRNVLTLAGLDEHAKSLGAPAYFRHVRYGLHYRELVFPIAQEYGFDPLFITSVIRQESLFEGFVHSTAGARGLMQIMPATGATLAEQIGWPPDYQSQDLYSPLVSVRLGTYYLSNNRRLLGENDYAALAAYNGGPGNAAIWLSLAPQDPDLLLEVIRYKETRDYIRSIYEIYSVYRSLYSVTE